VLALISQGRAVDTIPIVVGDAATQTLRQVVNAAEIADDATKREIENLAAQAIELVDSSTENARKAQDGATRAETAAGNAKTSETRAASSASGAKSSASAAASSASKAATSEQHAEESATAAATSASQAEGSAASAKQDADRAANIADSTSWDGDKLIVNGQTSPSLTGPKGDRGDQGQDGKDGASTWSDITGKPSTFPPAGHRHSTDDIDGMDAYADSEHTHKSADIEDAVSDFGYSGDANKLVKTDSSGKIRIGGTPTLEQHVATKSYVDTALGTARAYTDSLIVVGDTGATDGKLHIVYE